MLQQILKDMYIDPELLEELSDEQKQILYCKMREEQVRRWRDFEEKLSEQEKKKLAKPKLPPKPGKSMKKVDFMVDGQGRPWTWVMGEHTDDRSVEQILEEEEHSKARTIAEQEAEQLRKKNAEETERHLKVEQERIRREEKESEEKLKREAEQAALYQSMKEARETTRKLGEETKRKEEEAEKQLLELEQSEAKERRTSEAQLRQITLTRATQIYVHFKNAREKMRKQMQESGPDTEAAWREQEKRAKEAERRIRDIARTARASHRQTSLRATEKGQDAAPTTAPNNNNNNNAPAHDTRVANYCNTPSTLPRPRAGNRGPRPNSRKDIVDWFRSEEMERKAGRDASGRICPWFHGIISRQEAEALLEEEGEGAFVVRVSERIWGYAISYSAAERCKHFLIDCSDASYQFFGTNQLAHASLTAMVDFHCKVPVTMLGQELLTRPIGQRVTSDPDYRELISLKAEEMTKM
ncbi:PREDICTED: SH2 domain-containing protein 4B-like [Priapulus caudatus]|uniref:SH2 domain-containing protein 4B-like n=1 Tax=Priapulus caudatus TaxID=37621 RepID=A0ABM1F3H4_PRICU|nr:PREDICTED: SH2 domain-containing protein 4B-like [Priapulus caudatus]